MNIVVLDGYALNPGDISWEQIERLGNITVYDRTSAEETVSRIGHAEIVLTNKTLITESVLELCPSIRYIGVLATGYNVVDLKACSSRGIIVTNVPGYSTRAVAQFVFALLLEICSHVRLHGDSVRRGDWITSPDFCYWKAPLVELDGKTLGIFGYGSIGRTVAQIAQSIGMNVLCCTRSPDKIPAGSGVFPVDREQLFAGSDVISLHTPLTEETENLINRQTLARMKDGVIIINTARGPLVNEADMRQALECGKVGAYGADVVCREPMATDNPLKDAPNCILTPHIAWATKEARQRLMGIAADNIAAFLQGNPVNRVC